MQVTDVKRIFRVEHGTGRNSDDYERRYSNMERNNIVEFYTAHGTWGIFIYGLYWSCNSFFR